MAQKFIGETSGKYWKQKNDETYVNEDELVKITDLDESESVDDDDLLIKGNASTGTMLRIKVANFLEGIKEKLLGDTDISSVGDGTVSGAIDALDKKDTELNSALASKADSSTVTSLSSTVSSLSDTVSSESPRIYRLNLGSSGNLGANFCFPIASYGIWPAIIYSGERVAIMLLNPSSAGSSLSSDPVTLTWLNGSQPSNLNNISIATHTGETNGIRIKFTYNSGATVECGIIPLRGQTCYNYYLSST